MKLEWGIILQAMNGKQVGAFIREFRGVSTDSRSVLPGQLYFALSGERFDGHDFCAAALQKGAAAIVVSSGRCQELAPRIVVDEPLAAMQALAASVRMMVDIPVVAITGSHGKTTTKDMLTSILSRSRNTLSTFQNLNGVIGVPLTLMKLESCHEALVIEVGISIPGEMKRLASIVEPTQAIFTCVALAHSQFMPSLQDIVNEKKELIAHLRQGGQAILNADDPTIMANCSSPGTITFGLASGDFRGKIFQTDSSGITFEYCDSCCNRQTFFIPIHGQHNVLNAMAAITSARLLGVSDIDIQRGLDSFNLSPHRSHIIHLDKLTIVDDSYNAAPKSMRCALQLLADYPASGRRVAILGDMLELGKESCAAHRDLGSCYPRYGIDFLVTFGSEMEHMAKEVDRSELQHVHFHGVQETAESVLDLLQPSDIVLIKASRSMHADVIVDFLQKTWRDQG